MIELRAWSNFVDEVLAQSSLEWSWDALGIDVTNVVVCIWATHHRSCWLPTPLDHGLSVSVCAGNFFLDSLPVTHPSVLPSLHPQLSQRALAINWTCHVWLLPLWYRLSWLAVCDVFTAAFCWLDLNVCLL